MLLRGMLCAPSRTGILQPSVYLSGQGCRAPHLKDQGLQEAERPVDSLGARDIKHVKWSHQRCQGHGAVIELGELFSFYVQRKLAWIRIEGIFYFQHWCRHLHLN